MICLNFPLNGKNRFGGYFDAKSNSITVEKGLVRLATRHLVPIKGTKCLAASLTMKGLSSTSKKLMNSAKVLFSPE